MYLSILVLPLFSSIISGLLGRKIGQKGNYIISSISISFAALLSILAFYEIGINGSSIVFILINWVDSEILEINWGLSIDSLTISMIILVLIVSACVHCYAIGYMNEDPLSILGRCYYGEKLPNSGETLKLMVPSHNRKIMSVWTNHLCMVISHKMSKNKMGNRGSKSNFITKFVKEQRVNGNWCKINNLHLRCTLMDFERNYQVKNLSNQLNIKQYSNFYLSPWFWSGLIDAEGSFSIIIDKKINRKVGWRIQSKFQIGLHIRD